MRAGVEVTKLKEGSRYAASCVACLREVLVRPMANYAVQCVGGRVRMDTVWTSVLTESIKGDKFMA